MVIRKKALLKRIKDLEEQVQLNVPVVDADGEPISEPIGSYCFYSGPKYKKISFKEVCQALQDMCDIEITYQEIPGIQGSSQVVIYEKDGP